MIHRHVHATRDLSAGWRVARFAGMLLCAAIGAVVARAQGVASYSWTTIAGTAGAPLFSRVDATGPAARFYWPFGIAIDNAGELYVADSYNHSLRKVSTVGAVTTLAGATTAGFEDATGLAARFNNPEGVAVDGAGNVYVADTFNHAIRKVTSAGVVRTIAGSPVAGFADGPLGVGRLNFPRGLALDNAGNLFIADSGNHAVRKLDPNGLLTTVAGTGTLSGSSDGTGTSARFLQPWSVALDSAGNLYVADYGNSTIRRITPAGVVTTFAGSAGDPGSADGTGAAARFFQPGGVAVDNAGTVFVADTWNHTIRRITAAGVVTTIGGKAGTRGAADGLTGVALFSFPYAIAVDAAGSLYVADQENSTIRGGVVPRAPVITAQPQNVAVTAGVGATFSVLTSSIVGVTYQWSLNGTPIAGATAANYAIGSAQVRDAGNYTVVVTNVAGSTTSAPATLSVNAPPAIATAPLGTTLSANGSALLAVTAVGSGSLTYQWVRDGVPVTGATNATLTTSTPGSYTVVVSNTFGSVTSAPARVDFPNRLVNLSTRGNIGGAAGTLLAGLVVQAPAGATKALLIRGIGPALRTFGVEGAVAQTAVTIFDARGATLASNQGWFNNSNLAQIVTTTAAVGAFPLASSSGDSAVLVNLAAGNYTVTVSGAGGATGNSLVEIYEVDADTTRLVNLSTRGQVTSAAGLTAGVVVQGTISTRVLVRAVGPGLTQFGVAGALARPVLTVYKGTEVMATNSGWGTAANAAQIAEAAVSAGAFSLAAGSDDSALLVTLQPGNGVYTAQVSSANGASGAVLIEVYQVP